MARYVILRHEDMTPPRGLPPVLVVRDGWSWLAFLFPLFWLLWHRIWFASLAVLAAMVAIALIAQSPPWMALGLPLSLLLGLFVGLEGQNARIGKAQLQGYAICDLVDASSRAEAELRLAIDPTDDAQPSPLGIDMVAGRALRGSAPDVLFAAPGRTGR